MSPAARRRRLIVPILAVSLATLFALGLAEIAVRLLVGPTPPLGRLGYADGQGVPLPDGPDAMAQAVARGLIVPVPGKPPRARAMFAPDQTFYLTYTDNDVLQRDWFNDQGRVANHINHWGLRERDEITTDKPTGQRRIVCLGDSFTFGWGIPAELGWARMLENELRDDGIDVRTVNCGAAGTVCIDEYVVGLEQRFVQFQPDAVILTICLNDLIPSSGLNLQAPPQKSGSALFDLARGALGRGPLDLDPARDWVQELLDLPSAQAVDSGLCNHDRPFEAMWSQGVPQQFLRRGKAWCDARGVPFLVVIWPFLQGLGPGRNYPFQKLHDLVAADCKDAGIPLLDVTPALRGHADADLWVTPADPHPNPLANRLVMPSLSAFVRTQVRW